MSAHVRTLLAPIILGIMLSSCAPEINVNDIPVYPKARNITREGPLTAIPEFTYVWRFTTNDAPDVVWQFYTTEMSRKWGFDDQTQFQDRTLSLNSCPFYYLDMTSTSIDSTTYAITVKFHKEVCY